MQCVRDELVLYWATHSKLEREALEALIMPDVHASVSEPEREPMRLTEHLDDSMVSFGFMADDGWGNLGMANLGEFLPPLQTVDATPS